MKSGALGKIYEDGTFLVRQGEPGEEMFVIQDGEVETLVEKNGRVSCVAVLGKDEIAGEMSIFDREIRSASLRARGTVRALTVDRKNLFARISEDPTLAFRIIRTLCRRVRVLNDQLAGYQGERARE
jgi:CRP/FNR family cyclic AMP-dependent transcriptional regulator